MDYQILDELLGDLVSESEAARILGLKNPRTLSVWRSTGRHNLPYVKYGRVIRYRKSDLALFIEAHVIKVPETSSRALYANGGTRSPALDRSNKTAFFPPNAERDCAKKQNPTGIP